MNHFPTANISFNHSKHVNVMQMKWQSDLISMKTKDDHSMQLQRSLCYLHRFINNWLSLGSRLNKDVECGISHHCQGPVEIAYCIHL